MSRVETTPIPLAVLHLRALVCALGEAADPPWWATKFMSKAGMSYLERLYPRSFFQAAVHAAGEAAAEVHDRAVGRVGAYHLFRLPEWLEAEIHAVQLSADEGYVADVRSSLDARDRMLELLQALGGGMATKDAGPGPRQIGNAEDLKKTGWLRTAASAYHQGFSRGKPTFPYFTAEKRGPGR